MISDTKSRLEMIVLSSIASIGALICLISHYCSCGHMTHRDHIPLKIMMVDGIWLFALVACAVIGFRGRFKGARPVSFYSALLIVAIAATADPLSHFCFVIMGAAFVAQTVELAGIRLRANSKATTEPTTPDTHEPAN